MQMDQYQMEAKKTAFHPNAGNNFLYPTLGLCSEAGEIAGKIKKIIRDDGGVISPEKKEDLKKELGDVLWYVAQLATEFGFSLNEVAEGNITKLRDRKKRNVLGGSGDNR